MGDRRRLVKLTSIMDNLSHPFIMLLNLSATHWVPDCCIFTRKSATFIHSLYSICLHSGMIKSYPIHVREAAIKEEARIAAAQHLLLVFHSLTVYYWLDAFTAGCSVSTGDAAINQPDIRKWSLSLTSATVLWFKVMFSSYLSWL